MKKLILFPFLLFSVMAFSQQFGKLYVVAKSGLNMRTSPSIKADVVDIIPYGSAIEIKNENEELKSFVSENMMGFWQKVTYKDKSGYILDSYLIPWEVPELATVKEFGDYLKQVTKPFGKKLTVREMNTNLMEENGWQISKQLYENGAEWQHNSGYEYGADIYFLPGFSIQQGFLLLRLIPEFSNAIGENDAFPNKDVKTTRDEKEFTIKVDKEMFGDNPWYKKIDIEYEDGAYYMLQLFTIDNQLVISFGSGV
ncbi:MAG: SH3 domain-containing protein [Chitinophagaceae bacterium]|nr:SH3 domain-containing protein [Chitinophagaceae bacterium]